MIGDYRAFVIRVANRAISNQFAAQIQAPAFVIPSAEVFYPFQYMEIVATSLFPNGFVVAVSIVSPDSKDAAHTQAGGFVLVHLTVPFGTFPVR